MVRRSLLLQQLKDAWATLRVATIVAPSGYGKSTLLDQISSEVEELGVRVARLDSSRGECAAALTQRLIEAFNFDDRRLVSPKRNDLAWLVDQVGASRASHALIVDDIHLCGPECCALLTSLLKAAPGNLRFVVASRGEMPLPVGMFRVRGELRELSQASLRFSCEEAEALAALGGDSRLDKAGIRELVEKTEGWAAGLQLFCLAVSEGSDPIDLLKEFNGRDRGVADYFGEAVLDAQTVQVREFLLRVCALDTFSAELCTELYPDFPGPEICHQIESSGCFLVALDRQRRWFRFHRLFRDFLRSQAEERQPQVLQEDRRRASRWFAGAGLADQAIACSLAAGDAEQACGLIAAALPDVQRCGEYEKLLSWLERVPAQSYAQRLCVRRDKAWALVLTGLPDQAEAELEEIEKSRALRSASAAQIVSMIRCVSAALHGDIATGREACLAWLGKWRSASDRDAALVATALAHSHLRATDVERGLGEAKWARVKLERADAAYDAVWAAAIEARLHLIAGSLELARDVLAAALAAADRALGSGSRAASMIAAMLAETCAELGHNSDAEIYLARVVESGGDVVTCEQEGPRFDAAVRIAWWWGDAAKIGDVVREVETRIGRVRSRTVEPKLAAESIKLHLLEGDVDEAKAVLRGLQRDCAGSEIALRELLPLSEARILLHLGRRKEALAALNTLCVELRRSNRRMQLITAMLLKAACLERSAIERDALRVLEEALKLAEGSGAIGRIVAERHLIGGMFATYTARRSSAGGNESPFFGRLRDAFQLPQQRRQEPVTEAVAEPALTAKETRVLCLLADGMTNKELAAALFVSEKTIKWHLGNIFEKLRVENRTSAVALARKMLLIS